MELRSVLMYTNIPQHSAHHGIFTASVPLLLNGDTSQIYRTLTLSAKVTVGCITVSPSHIAVQPVPLRVSVTAQFSVSLHGFSGYGILDAYIFTYTHTL